MPEIPNNQNSYGQQKASPLVNGPRITPLGV